MDAIADRLVNCFRTVFPDLPEAAIPTASHASVPAWDSVAAITLLNVIEDEFGIPVDFDLLAELSTFDAIRKYLNREMHAS